MPPNPRSNKSGRVRAVEYGLSSRYFRTQLRWQVEDALAPEFLSKLNATERAWYDRFNREFHDGRFSSEPLHTDPEARRALYRAHHGARRDAMAYCLQYVGLGFGEDDLP